MGFLKNLFGGKDKKYVDEKGIYFYVQCDNCNSIIRVRADKQNDLNNTGNGYQWHKTIVDSTCFRRMTTIVTFDGKFNITDRELSGGTYVSEADYKASLGEQEASE